MFDGCNCQCPVCTLLYVRTCIYIYLSLPVEPSVMIHWTSPFRSGLEWVSLTTRRRSFPRSPNHPSPCGSVSLPFPVSITIFVFLLLLTGRWYEAEICAILLPLRCSFRWYPFLSIIINNNNNIVVSCFSRNLLYNYAPHSSFTDHVNWYVNCVHPCSYELGLCCHSTSCCTGHHPASQRGPALAHHPHNRCQG